MFKKPLAHQGNATPIRSSARRRLLSSILEQYPSLTLASNEEPLASSESGRVENDTAQRDLGRLIFPEGVKTCHFETSAGLEGVRVALSAWRAQIRWLTKVK